MYTMVQGGETDTFGLTALWLETSEQQTRKNRKVLPKPQRP